MSDGLGELFPNDQSAADAKALNPAAWQAVEQYWAASTRPGSLSERLCELILIAVHMSPSTLDLAAARVHVARARALGIEDSEMLEALLVVAPLGVHVFAIGLPVLERELAAGGVEPDLPEMGQKATAIKEAFLASRGYWTEHRERIGRLLPDFFPAYMQVSQLTGQSEHLTPLEREYIALAVNCAVTHMYEFGVETHIRNALAAGGSHEEIVAVLALVSSVGTHTYTRGAAMIAEH